MEKGEEREREVGREKGEEREVGRGVREKGGMEGRGRGEGRGQIEAKQGRTFLFTEHDDIYRVSNAWHCVQVRIS